MRWARGASGLASLAAAAALTGLSLCAPPAALASAASASKPDTVTLTGYFQSSLVPNGHGGQEAGFALHEAGSSTYPLDLASTGITLHPEDEDSNPSRLDASGQLTQILGDKVRVTGSLSHGVLSPTQVWDLGSPAEAAAASAGSGGGFWASEEVWLRRLYIPLILLAIAGFVIYRVRKSSAKADKVGPDAPGTVSWDDVAGCDEAKGQLREVVDFLISPDELAALGGRAPRGVLLSGPPGCGKTLLAKACAGEAGATFFSMSGSAFVEMYVGRGAARLRGLFRTARRHADVPFWRLFARSAVKDPVAECFRVARARSRARKPVIIFIDELDAVGRARGNDMSGERDHALNQLLVEMDGFSSRDNIIVIGATNRPTDLDAALLRPGRFDRHVEVTVPDLRGRERILGVHTRTKPVEQVDLSAVAARTFGLSGAELANLCDEAAILAFRAQRDHIIQADFIEAQETVLVGLRTGKALTDAEKRTIAYHEAGHSVVHLVEPGLDTPQTVTIVPRSSGALGYNLTVPYEDRYLAYEGELHEKLTALFGGRAAEEVALGSRSNGAGGDLQSINEIAGRMLDGWGMGTDYTILAAQGPLAARRPCSEAFLAERDGERSAIMRRAHERAVEIISDEYDVLDAIAKVLLAEETIDKARLLEVVGAAKAARAEGVSGGRASAPDWSVLAPGVSDRERVMACGAEGSPLTGGLGRLDVAAPATASPVA
jgi:cell division protease FtsH